MSANNLIVYIDFDRTLYDSGRFGDTLWAAIAVASNLSIEQIRADIPNFMTDPKLGGYEYIAHTSSYGIKPAVAWAIVKKVVLNNNYLYADSAAFIQALRATGYDPMILSFGETKFQHIKIEPTLEQLAGVEGHRD